MSALLLLLLAAPESRIEKVTVLADRAEVVRVASAPCASGQAEVVVAGLPASFDERTIQASAAGAARAIGSTVRLVPASPTEATGRRKVLEDALVAARDQQRALEDRRRVLLEESEQLAAYVRYTEPLIREEMRGAKPSPEAWKKNLDQLWGRQQASQVAVLALDPERRAIEREIARLELRLQLLASAPETSTREVTVAVACGTETTARVSVAYVVPGATWRPEYEVRFVPDRGGKTGPGKVEITVAAVVSQATGEDWTDAAIALSTAKPRLGAEAPLPARITVDGQEVSDQKVMVQGVEDRSSLSGSSGAAAASSPTGAALEDGGRAFTLAFPGRATVLSDGRPYWMPVDAVSGKAAVKLVAVPKSAPHVYQAVSFENPARYPLLAGRARMHRGASYVGDVQVEHVAPGAPVELSLGIDGELRIERKDVKDVDRSPGLLSSTRKIERELLIRVHNQSVTAERVEVRENIPVSKDEALEVVIDRAKTSVGMQHDATRGFTTWVLEVPKGGEKSVTLAYTVKLPSSWK